MISEVQCCDCMDFMKGYPDKFFDLAIVDVPYGIGASKGTWGSSNMGIVTDYGRKEWDFEKPKPEYFKELFRVSKNQIIWGANHFISLIPNDSSCWVVWDKDNSADFADCELAWTSFNTAVRKFKWRWNGMIQENMSNKQGRIHPTEKPFQLYSFCLNKYGNENDKILDTHLGSGSSRIAAYKLGFDFWGCEIDKDYFEAQEKRFKEAINEPLFQTQPERIQAKLL